MTPKRPRISRSTASIFAKQRLSLDDPLSYTFPDIEHSTDESRFITMGLSARGRLLVVAHTESNESIRIISARVATRTERKVYEEDQSQ